MNQNESLSMLRQLMLEFAGQTGLSPQGKPLRRYLWTDAFAVCNFLELYRRTGDDSFKSLALLLVNQVHEQLGRHREDEAAFSAAHTVLAFSSASHHSRPQSARFTYRSAHVSYSTILKN